MMGGCRTITSDVREGVDAKKTEGRRAFKVLVQLLGFRIVSVRTSRRRRTVDVRSRTQDPSSWNSWLRMTEMDPNFRTRDSVDVRP